MSNHKYIYLEPECCADSDTGRMWCGDPDPTDCEDGKCWTTYIICDEYEKLRAENAAIKAKLDKAVDRDEIIKWTEQQMATIESEGNDMFCRGAIAQMAILQQHLTCKLDKEIDSGRLDIDR